MQPWSCGAAVLQQAKSHFRAVLGACNENASSSRFWGGSRGREKREGKGREEKKTETKKKENGKKNKEKTEGKKKKENTEGEKKKKMGRGPPLESCSLRHFRRNAHPQNCSKVRFCLLQNCGPTAPWLHF